MIGFTFDSARCQKYLDALNSGGSIEPSGAGDGWTGNEMLILAGACLMGAYSQGPDAWWQSKVPRSREHAEAIEESFSEELHSTAGLAAGLAAKVLDNEFDGEYLPVVKFIAEKTDDGVRFHAFEGRKGN